MTRLLNLWLFVAAGIVGAALLAPSAPAWAHVNAGSTSTGDGLTVVRFSFTHGCGESPTTSLRVQIPANASNVTADENPGWTSSVTSTEIRWTGGTAPDGTKTTFSATMKLAGQVGETVFFPTLQGCVEGENTWIAKSDDPEADDAAPRITLDVTTPSDEPDETVDPVGGRSATSSTARRDHCIADDHTSWNRDVERLERPDHRTGHRRRASVLRSSWGPFCSAARRVVFARVGPQA